jgi:tetratricopeptide (TPR) repeat protein
MAGQAGKGRSGGGDRRAGGSGSRGARPSARTGSERRSGPAGSGRKGGETRRSRAGASAEPRTPEQTRYDGPPLDDDITGRELDPGVQAQLRSLPERLALRVGRHLVAAGRLLDEDPATAYEHAKAARARAARVAVVREACGETAYAAGRYADALAELRAARRMNGSSDYLPVMADCERALGRPERALALARNPAVERLSADLRTEMTIVEAGARRDLGELDAALRTLEAASPSSRSRADWVVRLRYAYADTLLAAGRTEDAVAWFHRTAGIDRDRITDAAERLGELVELPLADPAEGDDPHRR